MASFSFFKQAKPKTPSELVKATRYVLFGLDSKLPSDPKALEEAEKNLAAIKQALLGDVETEPNPEQISQIVLEACRGDFLETLVQKLPLLTWEARKDSVQIWSVLLRQKIGISACCLEYLENHLHLLDLLVICYQNKDAAINAGAMLRECARYPSLVKYLLESSSFDLFFGYVELPNFDIASDSFATFKELLTKHETVVSEYLSVHYAKFFGRYEHLLSSVNYVTRRQSLKLLADILLEKQHSNIMMQYITEVQNLRTVMTLLKDSSKNIRSLAFHLFKVFVANPRKPPSIVKVLSQNCAKLLSFLEDFHLDKEDEQFEEEKEMVVKELEGLADQE
ncbi:hypothetical protein GOP47_0024518 [Adiantum capillus-veneris]|uniref:Uncharacterized protein n=1 Tax=Adiantum capillus-veneris TaxID=13818 RepID=A0A9D4Z2T0_ADICA|nr:hypothetical protein GOP47_0024518 [Adiantum capillus-veneris]